jgi:hypothetical protein
MVTTVQSRPSHYAMLGLAPGASGEEIAAAFARELKRPRAFGGIAELSIAYEALRDPIKRRAYDVALGLAPAPRPGFAMAARRDAAQAMEFVAMRPVAPPVRDPSPPSAAPVQAPRPPFRPEPEAKARRAPEAGGGRVELRLADPEAGRLEWARSPMTVGALVAAVVLLGGLAGWQARSEPQQPQPAVTAALPPPRPFAATALPPPAPVSGPVTAQPRLLSRAPVAGPPVKPSPAPPRPSAWAEQMAEGIEAGDGQPAQGAAAVAEAAPVAAAAAVLPLPKAVIARTIERIGYACGDVASAVESGSPGVYTVTCTSGETYQAAPVHGRYRFRRLGSH